MLENSNAEYFYITLPSTSSFGHPGSYKTALERDVVVNPAEWEVGLTEMMYSRTWLNVIGTSLTSLTQTLIAT